MQLRPSNTIPAATCLRPRCVRVWASLSTAPTTSTTPLKVWLRSKEVEATIGFEVLAEGKGQAVVVVDVTKDSEAFEAGIVRGQKLVGVSDPVRDSEVWELGDRPSIRFVRDAIRARRMGYVQLVFADYLNVSDPAWRPTAQQAQDPAAAGQNSLGVAGASLDDGSSLPGGLLDSFISDAEEGEKTNMTVGERMAAQYEAQQRAALQVTDVKRRIDKRAAYMDEVSQRNDSPLVLGLLAAFLLPPAVILAIASSSGYLERLYEMSLTLR